MLCLAPMPGASDEQLMQQYGGGEAEAFATLYARHKDPVFRYLLRHGLERTQAEELFQEIWMGVIRAAAKYDPSARFTTWLYRIAHNRLIDHWRAQGRRPETSGAEHIIADERTPERATQAEDQLQRLRRALDELPHEQRDAFLLKQQGGLSLEALAEVAGVNRETAKSRLRYAYRRLKAALGGTP